jgi:hypothetical protein
VIYRFLGVLLFVGLGVYLLLGGHPQAGGWMIFIAAVLAIFGGFE